jgi:hypothetical protein
VRTDAASISCIVAPYQKIKLIGWTDPALDIIDPRYRVRADQRDSGLVRPTRRARRVHELAPLNDDRYPWAHLLFRV